MGGVREWGGLVVGSDTLVLPRNNGGADGSDRWNEGAEWEARGNGAG